MMVDIPEGVAEFTQKMMEEVALSKGSEPKAIHAWADSLEFWRTCKRTMKPDDHV